MIQYQEIKTKEDYLRWQMHYNFRNKLIKESMTSLLKASEGKSFEQNVIDEATEKAVADLNLVTNQNK